MQRLVGGRSDGSASGLRDSPATHVYPASVSLEFHLNGGRTKPPCFYLGVPYVPMGDKQDMRVGEIRLYHTSQCEVACDILNQ